MTGIALKMFLVVTVPVILGMIIRKVAENFISSKVGIFNKLNIVLFAIFFFAAFYEEKENLVSFIMQAGLITLIFLVECSRYYIPASYSWLYIPGFLFPGHYSDLYSWFYIPRLAFQFYIPGIIFLVLYSRFYVGFIFPVSYSSGKGNWAPEAGGTG